MLLENYVIQIVLVRSEDRSECISNCDRNWIELSWV